MLPYIRDPLERDLVFPINTMKQQAELPTIQEGEKRRNEKKCDILNIEVNFYSKYHHKFFSFGLASSVFYLFLIFVLRVSD